MAYDKTNFRETGTFGQLLPVHQNLASGNALDKLVQERRNSIANALELRISYTNPSSALWMLMLVVIVFCQIIFFMCNPVAMPVTGWQGWGTRTRYSYSQYSSTEFLVLVLYSYSWVTK